MPYGYLGTVTYIIQYGVQLQQQFMETVQDCILFRMVYNVVDTGAVKLQFLLHSLMYPCSGIVYFEIRSA